MEFIKKNYEKIILGAVLLGLVGVLALMPFMIIYDQQKAKEFTGSIVHPHVPPLPPLDMSNQTAVLDRLKSPEQLDFSTTNKIFNPVLWQKNRDGIMFKAAGFGPNAAVATNITPLYFTISLDSVITNTLGNRYVLIVESQAATLPALRHPQRKYISDKEKLNGFFRLDRVIGPPDAPTELDFTLADTGDTATVKPGEPFRRLDGYTADVRYDFDVPPFHASGVRVGDHVSFAGDDYNVIDIQSNAVILLAQSNQKKYTLRATP